MRKETKKNLLVLFIALLVAFLIAEVAVRVYFTTTDKHWPGANEDEAFRNNWYHSRASQDFFNREINPYEAYSAQTGWGLVENFKHPFVTINSDGIRANKEYSLQKEEGIVRIVAVGDSFTFAETVQNEFMYTKQMEDIYPNIEVLNLGVPAFGVDQMYLRFLEKGVKYNPDIIVVAIFLDDVARNYRSFYYYPKPRYEIKNDELVVTNTPVPTKDEIISKKWQSTFDSQLWNYISYNFFWLPRREQVMYDEGFAITSKLLDSFKEEADKIGAEVVVVRIVSDDPEKEKIHRERLAKLVAEKDLVYIDTEQYFDLAYEQAPKESYWNGHYNPNGNRVAAIAVIDGLINNGLLEDIRNG